jgi:hypothetical protein
MDMQTDTPGVEWINDATLRVNERGRRTAVAFGKACLGLLPAAVLLQNGAKAVFVVPVAVAGLVYALVWIVRGLRMEFIAGPDGITIRDVQKTRTLTWSEVDSFVDAFIPVNQGRAQWALGIKTTSGEVILAQMTANGKPQGRASTVQALRTVAWRYAIGAQLTGEAGSQDRPDRAGWHLDPDGKPGERFFNGAMWGPIRRHPDPRVPGATFESWDPRGDATTALELYTTEARAQAKKRNKWVAITTLVLIAACALWGSEDHKGGHFTLAALAFAAAAACAWRAWGFWAETRALERIVWLATAPVPLEVGKITGYIAPEFRTSPAGDQSPSVSAAVGAGAHATPRKRDRGSVWSLVCSIAGLALGLPAIVGIILGFRARKRVRTTGGAARDVNLATAGIVVGIWAVVVWVSVTILTQVTSSPPTTSSSGLAHQALLQPSDYQKGWRDQGSGSGTFEASFFNSLNHGAMVKMVSCLGMSTAHVDIRPTEVVGHAFAGPSHAQWATDTIDVFPSSAAAAVDEGAAANPKAATCEEQHEGAAHPDFQADNYFLATTPDAPIAIVPRTDIDALGTDETDLEVSFPYKAGPRIGELYIDMVFLRHGRVESNVWVINEDAQPSMATVDHLAVAANRRLASSQG